MKAIVQEEYGPPNVLQAKEIDKPAVGDDDVLVRVQAAAVHPGDYFVLTGLPYVVRLAFGVRKPKNGVPGRDVAGTVEAVGKDVTRFQAGDEVFGWCTTGVLAEYACAEESNFARKPVNLTFEQAAAVAVSGTTALQALRDHGEVQPEQKVLIAGASGGVGTFAVQIAKAFGAEVTGVCSTRNVDMVRSIGADHVIDYTKSSPKVDSATTSSSITSRITPCRSADACSPPREPTYPTEVPAVVGSGPWAASPKRGWSLCSSVRGCARSFRRRTPRTCSISRSLSNPERSHPSSTGRTR